MGDFIYNNLPTLSIEAADVASKVCGFNSLWATGDIKNSPTFGETGFNMPPSGMRFSDDGSYLELGETFDLWSSTYYLTQGQNIFHFAMGCYYEDNILYVDGANILSGHPVRLIKNTPVTSTTTTTTTLNIETVFIHIPNAT